MDISNYKSFGKFSPVYDSAVDCIFDAMPLDLARQAEKVLRVFAEHASNLGTCYPGLGRLMERSHYSETTVKRAMYALGELDYIRVHRSYNLLRQREELTYQLSPWAFWIQPQFISEAIALWQSTTLRCNEMFNGEPTPESESEPTKQTSIRTNRRITTTTSNDAIRTASPQSRTQGERTEQRNAQSQQRNAQNRTTASVPPPPPLSMCRNPLENSEHEETALEVVRVMNTRIAQARQLVVQFGAAGVKSGMQWLDEHGKNQHNIKNPFGLMKWWLESGALYGESPDMPKSNGSLKSSITGQYSDLFER